LVHLSELLFHGHLLKKRFHALTDASIIGNSAKGTGRRSPRRREPNSRQREETEQCASKKSLAPLKLLVCFHDSLLQAGRDAIRPPGKMPEKNVENRFFGELCEYR
jgi:hypothetical protein